MASAHGNGSTRDRGGAPRWYRPPVDSAPSRNPLALLWEPLSGFTVYRHAAGLGPLRAVVFMLLTVVLVGGVGALLQVNRLGRSLDAMEQSSIVFMPRVNIGRGVAEVEAAPGRLIETDRAVILFDTREEPAPLPKMTADDRRDRVLVGYEALLWFRPDSNVPMVLPWTAVNQMWGERVSVDGRELIEAWRRSMPRTVLVFALGIMAGLFLWELVLVGGLSLLYRALFGRRIGAPGAGMLVGVGAVATWPALVVAAVLALGFGLQEQAIVVHTLVVGALFLIGANSCVGMEPPQRKADAPKVTRSEL